MTGPSSASPQGHGSRRLRASIFFAVYAEIAFLVFLGVFLWRHANPKGDGMEMVGLSAAFMLIFLPLTLPAWILAKQSRFLVTAAFFAASPQSSISCCGSSCLTNSASRVRLGLRQATGA